MSDDTKKDESPTSGEQASKHDGDHAGGHDADHEGHVEAPVETDPDRIARRQLLAKVSLGLGAAGGVALGVPLVGFIVAPLGRKAPMEWRSVGKVADFKVGTTVAVTYTDASPLAWAGVTGKTAAWLRRVDETTFVAYSLHCAHLGCPVKWLPDARLFMCPCHGGVYYEDGSVAAGPPPHPLRQYPVRIREGLVEVHTEPIPLG